MFVLKLLLAKFKGADWKFLYIERVLFYLTTIRILCLFVCNVNAILI